jgi:hypothetical protein
MLVFAFIACVGIVFAIYAYQKGFLLYHHWNHALMALRYIASVGLVMVYDRWESAYRLRRGDAMLHGQV